MATQDPCKLIAPADLQSLGFTDAGTSENLGGAVTCNWNSDQITLHVDIRTKQGLADLVATGPVTSIQVGSHDAKKLLSNSGGCIIALGVTSSSRVDVGTVEGHGDQGKACTAAEQAAKLVEPKLPKS